MSSRVWDRRLFFSPVLPLLPWRVCEREGEWCGDAVKKKLLVQIERSQRKSNEHLAAVVNII
jgi:hypothetical protein